MTSTPLTTRYLGANEVGRGHNGGSSSHYAAPQGCSALYHAGGQGYNECVDVLLDQGADVDLEAEVRMISWSIAGALHRVRSHTCVTHLHARAHVLDATTRTNTLP